MRVYSGNQLREHSSLGIGGKADEMILPKNLEELVEAVEHCRLRGMDHVVVGAGSAVLFSDKGYRGCVIITDDMRFVDFRQEVAVAEAGVLLTNLIGQFAEHGLSGMEKLYGIPGTVGGAAYGNAGYMGTSIGDFVKSIIAVDSEGHVVEVPKKDVGFAYQRGYWGGTILTVKFDLAEFKPSPKEEIRKTMDYYLARRAETLPMGNKACRLFENVGGDSTSLLIGKCGLSSLRIGGAALWEKHPNYVVNLGNAKADDVITIVKRVSDALEAAVGVDIGIGIRVIGEL